MLGEVQKNTPLYISNSERTIMRVRSLKKDKGEMIMNEPKEIKKTEEKKERREEQDNIRRERSSYYYI